MVSSARQRYRVAVFSVLGTLCGLLPGRFIVGSACYTDRPFTEYRRFEFRVGHTELRAAIAALKKRWPEWEDVSEDPADFQLTHFNVNPEVHAPIGSRGQLGLAMRDIRLVLVPVDHALDRELR